ncbi:MAG: tRNA (adenosine(37)-N6)-threonylcarbamoyltransferase complex dimerization subunit type 1 TsaB [Myxococcales bacterium]|nr:tRNA (adenosine(37)-N6)-threonylcarbamoyltransferase complex dimerization subunit type 1 TsaB [Myxococcales bacterium]
MSAILAIDTSTLTASAAVVTLDGAPLAVVGGDPDVRTERVLLVCEQALAEAGVARGALAAIAVGAGPGSFTSLRIGLATGKGLAYALGVPLWLASSLAALAYDLAAVAPADDALLVAALDARRGEIYAGSFRRADGGLVAVGPERVLPPAELIAALDQPAHPPVHLAGDALVAYADALAALPAHVTRHAAPRTPSGLGVARAALAGDRVDRLHHGAPAYIRPSEAEVKYPDGVPGAWKR